MIDVKELRVGNKYMDSKGNIETVQQLMFYPLEKIDDLDPGYAFPIPLTAEILESAGFSSSFKAIYDVNWFGDGYYLEIDGQNSGTKVEFVHDLQNVYFALEREELSISLTAPIHKSR